MPRLVFACVVAGLLLAAQGADIAISLHHSTKGWQEMWTNDNSASASKHIPWRGDITAVHIYYGSPSYLCGARDKVSMWWHNVGYGTGCVQRCGWRGFCGSGCNGFRANTIIIRSDWSICLGYSNTFDRYFYTSYSYKCYDGNNQLLAVPVHGSHSVVVADTPSANGKINAQFKYTAKVGASDECRVYYIRIFMRNGGGSNTHTVLDTTAPQSVNSGTGVVTKSFNYAPNSAGVRYYMIWCDLGSASLPPLFRRGKV